MILILSVRDIYFLANELVGAASESYNIKLLEWLIQNAKSYRHWRPLAPFICNTDNQLLKVSLLHHCVFHAFVCILEWVILSSINALAHQF